LLPAREHRTRQKALLQIPAILAVGAFRICCIGSLKKIVFCSFGTASIFLIYRSFERLFANDKHKSHFIFS